MDVAEEIQQVADKVNQTRLFEAKKGSLGRNRSNHASRLPHPCLRALYYDRTAEESKLPPTLRAAFIFRLGKIIEREALVEIRQEGYEVLPPLQVYEWPEHNIVGSLDGILPLPSGTRPLEIKGVERHEWDRLIMVDALKDSKKFWVRGYVAQLNTYCFLANYEQGGVFWLKSKHTFEHHALFLPLDYELAEECVQKADMVNLHVECEEPPDRMPFDAQICGYCDYRETICGPPQPPRPRISDPEMIAFLEEREKLKVASGLYKKAQDRLKELFPEEAVVEVGPFEVRVVRTKRGLMRKVERLVEEERR